MRRFLVTLLALALSAGLVGTGPTAATEPSSDPMPATGPRPRTSYTPGTEADIVAKLARDPYRQIFLDAHALHEARRLSRTPGDPDRNAQKDMARAARWFAFEYALDRTVVGGAIVPFPDPAARQATGEVVEELLLGAYDRSRLAVPPPLGGWDRDLDTSGEIVQWTSALDLLLGAGFDFEGNDETIAATLTELTAELYRNYTDPATANGFADLHQNNHRTKAGVAFATAAVTIGEYAPDPATDPDGSRNPSAWWEYGITLVDDTLRHVLLAGDGAYAEGPHYYRFTTESIAVYVAMWERILGSQSWTTSTGRVIPALHHTDLFARAADWMLAMTLPDGALAPVDDANTHESYFFGALPPLPNASAYAWRWANAPQPFVNESSTDLALDSIVQFDDSVGAAPPDGSPTSFWYEGGNAVFRSDWGPDATVVIAQGEGPTASEFGRDATGLGRSPQSHEHMEPGSFVLAAHGETLVLDPGYLSFLEHVTVLQPSDHNMVLVDGEGPRNPLQASAQWGNTDPFGPPPQDGFATIHSTLDTDRLDTAVVTTRYGGYETGTDVVVDRRFVFVDNRYLVIADEVTPIDPAGPVDISWVVQGNGGGTSGGTFAPTADGGVWSRPGAGIETAIITDHGPPTFHTQLENHEDPTRRRNELTHEALHATVSASRPVRAIQVLVPTAAGSTPPDITITPAPEGIGARIEDPSTGRIGTVGWDETGLFVTDTGPADTVSWRTGDRTTVGPVTVEAPGSHQVVVDRSPAGALAITADRPAHSIVVTGAGPAATVDGACVADGTDPLRLEPGLDGAVTIHPTAGNAAPAAHVTHRYQRAPVGAAVVLDGWASCDFDGDPLTAVWEMTSAPRGSAWSLDTADPLRPVLDVDADGTYRLRLTVTDPAGASSTAEVVVAGGDRCFDERDDDLDGLFDGADPDCDGVEPAPTTDALGFVLPRESYVGVVRSGLSGVEVERGPDGGIEAVRSLVARDGRLFGLLAGVDATDGSGLVLLFDPSAGVIRFEPWHGTVAEPTPGTVVGLDTDAKTHWIALDRPLGG